MITRLLLTVLAAVTLALGPGAGVAGADTGELISSFDAYIDLDTHGDLQVVEKIEYDFGTDQRRGLQRGLRTRTDGPAGRRAYAISDLEVWGPAGTPLPTALTWSDGFVHLEAGDPRETVTGQQSYTLRYTVRGAFDALRDPRNEVIWDVLGTGWDVPVDRMTAVVRAPQPALGARCVRDAVASPGSCVAAVGADYGYIFSASGIAPHEQLTIALTYPVGTVSDPQSLLPAGPLPTRSPGTALPDTEGTDTPGPSEWIVGIGMALVVVAGLVVLMVVSLRMSVSPMHRRRTTGARAAAEEPASAGPAPPISGTPLDLRPGHLAVLQAGRAEPDAVVATLLDLAARGFLAVEEQPRAGWTLVQALTPGEPLLDYEATLLRAAFSNGDRVAVDDLRAALGRDLGRVRDQLLGDAAARGWFAKDVFAAWTWWRWLDRIGWVLSLAACLLAAVPVLRPTPTDALSVIGFLLVAAGTFVLRRLVGRLAARRLPLSATGDAVLAGTSAFRAGLTAAWERWERAPRAFDGRSRSLPYAVALGLARPWSDVFAGLRRSGLAWVVTTPAPDPGGRG